MLLRQIQHTAKRTFTNTTKVARPEAPGQIPKVVLYTGTDCSLCDVVKVTLEEVKKEIPYDVQHYNIRDDSLPDVHKYRRLYQYDIPVIHLNGQEIARHRLDKEVLMRKLREAADEGQA